MHGARVSTAGFLVRRKFLWEEGRKGALRLRERTLLIGESGNGINHGRANFRVADTGCGCLNSAWSRTFMTSSAAFSSVGSVVAESEMTASVNRAPVNILEYIETIQQSGGKAAVLFSDAPPVLATVDFLCMLKDLPGMTWISTIICATVIVRTFVGLPVAITQQKAIGRFQNLKPELQKLAEELKRETAIAIQRYQWSKRTARIQYTKSFKKHWRRIVEENNCHPMKSIVLTLIQLPFWVSFSTALRNVVYAVPLPRTSERVERWIQIHNESTPWINSLVLPDPIVFPLIFLGANLINIEYTRKQKLQVVTSPESKLQKALPWVFRGVIVTITIFATSVPSAVSMYWATSSSLALAQNVFLRSETARNLFKLPSVTITTTTAEAEPQQKSQQIGKSGEKAL